MCLICVLYVSYVLHVSYMCLICVLYVSYVSYMSYMCPICLICVLYVSYMCPICVLYVSYMCLILMSPSVWPFIAETCRRGRVYGCFVLFVQITFIIWGIRVNRCTEQIILPSQSSEVDR
jgi:hypothetical protein